MDQDVNAQQRDVDKEFFGWAKFYVVHYLI